MGFRESVKKAFSSPGYRPSTMANSSSPPVSRPATSSRLAVRLEEAKEHANISQRRTDDHQHRRKQLPASRHTERPSPSPSSTQPRRSWVKSIGSGIMKSFSLRRSSKRKSEQTWPKIELYKAHEVPLPKYRGPVDKKHMAVLAAYSIVKATKQHRRLSIDSNISPLATRAPSRAVSIAEKGVIRRPGDADVLISETSKDASSPDEYSNTTSILSTDGEATDTSSHTLLTSHTAEEELDSRSPGSGLKQTTTFSPTGLRMALNTIE